MTVVRGSYTGGEEYKNNSVHLDISRGKYAYFVTSVTSPSLSLASFF